MKIYTDKNFINCYGLVLENIFPDEKTIEKVKTTKDFISALKKSTDNPYINSFLKEMDFKINGNDITDEEGSWKILNKAEVELDDGRVDIYTNGSYWWLEETTDNEIKKYFYYTD